MTMGTAATMMSLAEPGNVPSRSLLDPGSMHPISACAPSAEDGL